MEQPAKTEPIAVGLKDAAKMLGISTTTAYMLKDRGEIPVFRFGGRMLVSVERLKKMVEELSEEGVKAKVRGN